jgi:hypothetical protein
LQNYNLLVSNLIYSSENGNGTTTISPFTNAAMLLPLRGLTNLLPITLGDAENSKSAEKA